MRPLSMRLPMIWAICLLGILPFGLSAQSFVQLPLQAPYLEDFSITPGAAGTDLPMGWSAYNNANVSLLPLRTTGAGTGAYNSGSRIGLQAADGDGPLYLEFVLENTQFRTDLYLSWRVEIVSEVLISTASLALEYSLDPANGYSPVPGSLFTSSFNNSIPQTFDSVPLPVALENQAGPVYLRWVYNENVPIPFPPNLGDRLSIDNVSLTWQLSTISVDLGPDHSQCGAGTYTIDATTPGAISYLWNTGETTPSIQVNTSGQYWVDVVTGQGFGSDTISVAFNNSPSNASIVVTGVAQAGAGTQASPDRGCPRQLFQYAIPNPTGYTSANYGTAWVYDTLIITDVLTGQLYRGASAIFPPQNTSGAIRLRPDFLDGGKTFRMRLVIRDVQTGCATEADRFFAVIEAPSSGLPRDTAFCAGGSITLAATPGLQSYFWSTGDITPSITLSSPTTVWVELTSIDGCFRRDSISVRIDTLRANFGESADTIVACGNYTLDAGIAGTYLWSNGATTRTATFSQSGPASVQVVSQFGCITRDTILLEILPQPSHQLPDTLRFCAQATANLNTGPRQLGVLYSWAFNGAPLPDTTPNIQVTAPGTYTATLAGAECTVVKSVVVLPFAQPTVDLGPDFTACNIANVTPTVTGDVISYQWSLGQTTPNFSVDFSGNFTLTVTTADGCRATDTISITVFKFVNFSFTAPDSAKTGEFVYFQSIADQPNVEWYWDFGNGATSTRDRDVYTVFDKPGTYTVKLAVRNNFCVTDTITRTIVITGEPVGTASGVAASVFGIHPNPASDYVTVLTDLPQALPISIELHTLSGQLVHRSLYEPAVHHNHKLSLNGLSPGVYVVDARAGELRQTMRLVVR